MAEDPTIHETPKPPTPSATASDLSPGTHDADAVKTVHDARAGPTTFTVAIGQRFGDYELLTEIARGGMGVVYRARQTSAEPRRRPQDDPRRPLANADDVARFRTEAEAAAKLAASQHRRRPRGRRTRTASITSPWSSSRATASINASARGPLACKVAARYVRILARAVHYAHQHGILHRDLKPSNILLDADDEPHITDFGLAKRLGHGDSGQTRTGAVLGTPSYMAPEQAQGKTERARPGQRRLQPGRDPVRAADRPAAVSRRDAARHGHAGDRSPAGAAAACSIRRSITTWKRSA